MQINQLALIPFYEQHKDEYIAKRARGNNPEWDEAYKWEILPKANAELAAFDNVTKDNVAEIIAIINKHKSNFAHWIDMDDLNLLAEKPNGFQIIREIWHPSAEHIHTTIDTANTMAKLLLGKEFSPSTFGYLLAAQDCTTFTIYRDALLKEVAELNLIEKPGSLSRGDKYKILNDSAQFIGNLLAEEKDRLADPEWHTALNGQDFLYVTIQYAKDNRPN